MQKYYKQTGYNPDFPMITEIWKYNTDPIPEWLIDRASVKGFEDNGKPILDIRKGVSGEIEIIESGRRNTLIKLRTNDSYILFSKTHPLISLTPHQFKLLYK